LISDTSSEIGVFKKEAAIFGQSPSFSISFSFYGKIAGQKVQTVDLKSIPAGQYLVKATVGTEIVTEALIVVE
jgi:hypothetical protein